jgi:hypothetical protein
MNIYQMPLEAIHFGNAVITKVEEKLSDGSVVFNLELSGVINCVDEKTADDIMAYIKLCKSANVAL